MSTADTCLPERLGGSWDQFVAKWCCRHAPAYDQRLVIDARRAVHELWPEGIDKTLHTGSRGLYPASALIDLGRLLCLVRGCEGFGELLARLRQGTQCAHAELITAGSLIQAGLRVRLGVACEGRVPDLAIDDVAGGPVFVEVTSPLESEESEERNGLVLELTDRLRSAGESFVIQIEFFDEPTRETVDALVGRVPLEDSGAWVSLGDAVRFRRAAAAAPDRDSTDSASSLATPERGPRARWLLSRSLRAASLRNPPLHSITRFEGEGRRLG